MRDSNIIRYHKIPIENGFDLDCLTKVEEGKIPVIVQKSALENRLANIGAKKVRMQRDLNLIDIDEQNTIDEINKIELILNS